MTFAVPRLHLAWRLHSRHMKSRPALRNPWSVVHMPECTPTALLTECKQLPQVLRRAQVLHCLDLYSGCGGTSHVHVDTPEVVIKAGWAVDCCPAMTDSFKVNHPAAQVGPAPRIG